MGKVSKYKLQNTETEETKKLFNKLRSNFSWEEIKKHREEFYKKELAYNDLKEKVSLTKEEEKELKKIVKYFKDLKEDLSKIKTYQYNTTHIYLMKSLKKAIANQ